MRGTGLHAALGSKGLRVPGAEAACGGKGGGSWEVKPEAREAGTREAVCVLVTGANLILRACRGL